MWIFPSLPPSLLVTSPSSFFCSILFLITFLFCCSPVLSFLVHHLCVLPSLVLSASISFRTTLFSYFHTLPLLLAIHPNLLCLTLISLTHLLSLIFCPSNPLFFLFFSHLPLNNSNCLFLIKINSRTSLFSQPMLFSTSNSSKLTTIAPHPQPLPLPHLSFTLSLV